MTIPHYPIEQFIHYLETHAIRLRDPDELRVKLIRIRADGMEKFQIVSDFDRTLTPQWLKDPCSQTGKLVQCHSSHGVIESSPFVSSAYAAESKRLADHYIPLEHNHKLSAAERERICVEWYEKAHNIMLGEDLTSSSVMKIVETCWSKMEIHLRARWSHLFSDAKNNSIPITLLSAGVADVIECILKLEGILPEKPIVSFPDDAVLTEDPVMVVGNRMLFSDDSRHIGFTEPVIHSLNKRGALADALTRSTQRAERPNALLMGDLIGDVDFVQSIPHLNNYIAVGFLADSGNHEERLRDYLEHFDIVVTGGGASMDVPIHLLKSLLI